MNTTYFLQGVALGFGSGITPGPFLALVVAASLRGGFRNGAVVSLSPLITDLSIVIACAASNPRHRGALARWLRGARPVRL